MTRSVAAHGLVATFGAGMWTCLVRTPTFYPDAVTLDPEAPADTVLARIDNSTGASIKDSFATLDFAPHGYDVLFEATWYEGVAGANARNADGWSVVEAADLFADWVAGWRGVDGPDDVWNPGVLGEPSLVFATYQPHGDVLAGALFNRGDDAIGISNVFTSGCSKEDAWSGAVGFAGVLFGDARIVGYGDDEELALATANGFADIGPLRVWIR